MAKKKTKMTEIDTTKLVREVKIAGWDGKDVPCTVHYTHYMDGHIAIQLFCEDGPYATASVNVDGLGEDEVAIKDYGENAGMLSELYTQRVITAPHRYVSSGYVVIPVCRLRYKED